ncbi:MAG: DUF3168 domain-containing protein [Pseudomonadota bacterium]
MSSAAGQLHEAVFKALAADAELLAELGPNRLFDQVPERSAFPYIVLGRQLISDWSTATEDGEAIVFFVHIWTDEKGRTQLSRLEAHTKRILSTTLPDMADHHLVNLRFQLGEHRRGRNSRHRQGVLRFRGVTEPR